MQVCERHPANINSALHWCKVESSGQEYLRHLYRLRYDTDITQSAYRDMVGAKTTNELLFELGFEVVDENGNVASKEAISEFLRKAERDGSLLRAMKPSKLYEMTPENKVNADCIILTSLVPQRLRDDKWLVCAVLEDRDEDQIMLLLLQRELELTTLTLVDEATRVPRLLEMQNLAAQSKVALAVQAVYPIRRKGHTLFCYHSEPIVADFLAYFFCIKEDPLLVRGLAYGVAQLILTMYAANITHGHLSIANTAIRYDTVDEKPQTVVNCFDFSQASCSIAYPELDIVSFLLSLSADITIKRDYEHYIPIFEDALNDVLKQIRKDKFERMTADKEMYLILWKKYTSFIGQLPPDEEADLEQQEELQQQEEDVPRYEFQMQQEELDEAAAEDIAETQPKHSLKHEAERTIRRSMRRQQRELEEKQEREREVASALEHSIERVEKTRSRTNPKMSTRPDVKAALEAAFG